VDRNLVSADAIREKLNHLVNDVRTALLDAEVLAAYMRDTGSTEADFNGPTALAMRISSVETSLKALRDKDGLIGIMVV